MKSNRKFITVDYQQALDQTVRIRECLPENHLARFVVAIVAQLDLRAIYQRFAPLGAPPYAPEVLLALLFYAYATGVFSSRKIEKLTYESIPFRYIAGGLHPDHATIANFRQTFLAEIGLLFVQILVLASILGVLKLGNISVDGSKIHADASKSKAVSYKRLLELEAKLQQEVEQLLALGQQTDQDALPEGLNMAEEITFRQDRLTNLAEAKAVLEGRAEERYQAEQAEYEAKMADRAEKEHQTGRKTPGPKPQAPIPGPQDKDQYNFTDPESRIMKNSNNSGFDQHYNAQVGVDQDSLLVVATSLSNHPNDKQEAEPTLDAISPRVGQPDRAAFDNGYLSPATIQACVKRGIEAYIASGREAHHRSWQTFFQAQAEPPAEDASLTVQMAYKLQTEIGQAIYRLRKSTVEPVIGIIKEVLGFRQFSLRGLAATAGEWCLVCLAFNLKRLHTLLAAG